MRIVKSLWLCGSTKPGQTTRPAGVDHALGALAVDVADGDDPPALDGDVAAERRGSRAVDDERVPDEEVDH